MCTEYLHTCFTVSIEKQVAVFTERLLSLELQWSVFGGVHLPSNPSDFTQISSQWRPASLVMGHMIVDSYICWPREI